MPEGALPTAAGFRLPKQRRLDWEQQADRAVEAFGRNGFFVLVDDRQVTDLDEDADLGAGTATRGRSRRFGPSPRPRKTYAASAS